MTDDFILAEDIVCLLDAPISSVIPLTRWLRREASDKALVKALSIARTDDTRIALCHLARQRHLIRAAASLMELLADTSPKVRYPAVEALATIGYRKAGRVILELFMNEPDSRMRVPLAIALGELEYRPAAPALIDALHDSNPQLRQYAASSLVGIGTQGAVTAVKRALVTESDAAAQKQMRWALARWKHRQRKKATKIAAL